LQSGHDTEDNGMAKVEEMEDARKVRLEFAVCLSEANDVVRKVDG